MKVLVVAAALAVFAATASAGAARDARPQAAVEQATTTVIADAGRLGSTSLTSLNGNATPWTPASRQSEVDFDALAAQVDTGTLLIALGLLVIVLARPVNRMLRRQEQHRRATALASTLGPAPHA